VAAGVEAANARLSRPEQIKRYTIVDGDWLPGGDELTPTMKLKRRPILEKYAAEIEAMYAPLAPERVEQAGDVVHHGGGGGEVGV
jgi:long-subunit acyl-CoA synthetase (AMP-forming)